MDTIHTIISTQFDKYPLIYIIRDVVVLSLVKKFHDVYLLKKVQYNNCKSIKI